jgi:hypothetical protein
VMPAASPAPLKICAESKTARVRRCSGGSVTMGILVGAADEPVI